MNSIDPILALTTRVETARLLLELAAKASFVLLAAAGVARLLRKSSAATRHLIWSSALVMVLAMPFGSLVLPAWRVPLVTVGTVGPSALETAADRESELRTMRVVTDEAARSADASGEATASAPSDSSATALPGAPHTSAFRSLASIDWVALCLGVWIGGAVLTVIRLSLGVVALWMVASRTRTVLSRDWLELTADLSRLLGLTRPVRLLQSRRATMPLSWGCVRPVVLLPADAGTWPIERRRIVLLHELAHVKRRDCLTQMLAQLVCAVYWFNPLVWFAASRMRAERERACDDLVLSAGTRSADYADHLLAIARAFRSAGLPSWATVAMARPSQLEGRLLAILDPSRRRRVWPRWACAAAIAAIAAIALPVAALQPWVAASAQTRALPSNNQDVVASSATDDQKNPAIVSGVAGGVEGGVAGGVRGGVEGAVTGGVRGGVEGGVEGGVAGGMVRGVAGAIADAVPDLMRGHLALAPAVVDQLQHDVSAAVSAELADVDVKVHGVPDQPETVIDRRVIDALVTALKDENKDVRQQAAETLGRVADARAIDGLTVALRDSSPDVREQAAAALARFKSTAAAGALLLALKDQSPAVRRQAVHGLARMRDPRHVDALTMMLQDADREVRQQAAIGLGQLRAASAIEPLSAALKDGDSEVRQQAVAALGQIRDARTGPALIAALGDSERDVREQAIVALAHLRLPAAVDPMMAALKDQSADVRQQAAFGLGQIRDARAVNALTAALNDSNADVRHQAVFALGQIRATSAVPALIVALADKSSDVREQAAFALGQIRDPRAVDPLTNALRDPDADVRQQAAFALGQLAHAAGKNRN